ncbi:MAG TPA: S9 family peptidase [Gemmatimonadaceae bacterium]|nr:S9 family peptidase [Gemmatimonadaceae bacterium]
MLSFHSSGTTHARVIVALFVGATISAAGRSFAQTTRFPNNEDLRHTRGLDDPQLSPDGRLVLATVVEPTVDGAQRHLWIVDVAGGTSRQLTFSPTKTNRGESRGRWSADGKFVFFTAHRGDATQLFKLPIDGGEAKPFDLEIVPPVDASREPGAVDGSRDTTASKPVAIDVASYSLSPNDAYAAIIARDPVTPGEKKQQTDKADAEWVDHDLHGERLYLLDLRTGGLVTTTVPPNVGEAVWSHASDRLVAISGPMNNASDLGPADTAWIVKVTEPTRPMRLTEAPPTIERVVWSADDSRLFFTAQAEADAPPGYSDLYVLPLAGGPMRNLSKSFRGSIGPAAFDVGASVIAAATRGTEAGYMRVDPVTGALTPLELGAGTVTQLATNARRTGWVYSRTSSDGPAAIYYTPSLGKAATRLSLPASAGDWRAVKARVVHWKSDGLTIEGLLYLPPDAASRRVPLVVNVHGGPAGGWRNSYQPLTQLFAGLGWAVLEPNPRGSTGYGTSFVAANKNDLGGGDYRDIMAGVNAVIASDSIDASTLALIGYSYGGEMAGFVEGKTDRFKAIVSGAPVIDQFSEYGTENGSWYDRWYFGKPWERMSDAWRQSPLAGAAHAKTPFLLLQGQVDATDPLGQSLEMYRALRQEGVPVQLVTYPRENHGPLSAGINGSPSPEPWHGFDARQRIVRFISEAFGSK